MSFNCKKSENISLISVVEDLPIGIILIDSEGIILIANSTFQNIVGGKNGNLIGKSIKSILKETYKEKFDNLLITVKDNKNYEEDWQKREFELITHNRQYLKVHINDYQLEENDVLFMGTISGDENVSKLGNELERQLNLKDDLKDDLEQESELSEMKSRFLSIASHEFRTPLAGILSSLNLIDRYIKADQQTWSNFKNGVKVENHLKKINESVKNLTTILNKFLALGNIEKGEIPIKFVTFNLEKVLKLQVSQFQELRKPGQEISYQHHGRETNVYLDKYLIKNIVNNLCSNAIKFSPENATIEFSSEIDKDNIRLIIKDNGIGIPNSEKSKIFHRFYRAKNALHYDEGTGLGLNIVKKYVELMKGSITFESEQNMGTTFFITFPKKQTENQ